MSGQVVADAKTANSAEAPRVAAAALATFIKRAFEAAGLRSEDADVVANLMVEADLRGSDTHGVIRLPLYLRRLKAGGIKARPDIRIVRERPATALVDGDNGIGHLVMRFATMTAIEKAKGAGVGWVGARMSNHAGPAALYAMMPLAHDMIGIYSVVASANHMAVWGGAETLLGTNPLAVAIPAGAEAPVVLDIATTVASYGTVKNYRLQGKQMPEGWMVSSRDGRAITDPERSPEGLLLPIGGYKGSGLALVLGLLAGTLNGASFGRDVVDFNADEKSAGDTGHFIVALDIDRFTPLAAFTAEVDRHLRDLRASRTLPGFDAIRLPGAERRRRRADRAANGAPLAPELLLQLDRLAVELGLAPVRER